ncbi:hypothetical protein OG785_02750 [Streptomyces sp. NBC_00006]|uniref:hypothetical protein n=1 Tax=unclassified Streptomyces TaxID=2593676 RepID=UPI002250B3CF|nr:MULTISPECIES: hypothetical protein [unclassified Streptomyces]MCX4834675.1 hypothetical protein [Streptomyces sp. NBC_01016]MCX5529494.1 hypothetical protein [Streptomyces sp. NBC_00006]
MKVHITIADDAGAAPPPGAGPGRQHSETRETAATGAVDAGSAPAAGAEQAMTNGHRTSPVSESMRPAGPVTDGGEAPGWLAELVRLADAGQVSRPGEDPQETRHSSENASSMDAGRAAPG